MAVAERDILAGANARMEEVFHGEARSLHPKYKPNAEKTFMLRYSRKDLEGKPSESAAEAHWRVAVNVSSVTVLYQPGSDWEEGYEEGREVNPSDFDFPFRTIVRQYNWLLKGGRKLKAFDRVVENGLEAWIDQAKRYYRLLARLLFVPNSPTWTGAGTPLGQLAACFVLPIEDSLIDGGASIMNTLKDAVAIQKTGGGNGFSFGRTRPRNSRVKSSRGVASGVPGWLEMYHRVFLQIQQGGSRRGANMGVCPIWHPDVLTFIDSKVVEGEVSTFNISVAITDEFMEAVKADSTFQLRFEGEDYGEPLRARDLFDKIIKNAHVIGDPGALFIDTANRSNPSPKYYYLESTNPCGEQWLGPYENCCLGSITVNNFVGEDGRINWEAYREVIETATEFLDDVVDANTYVDSVPELEVAAQTGRRIGLGLMGLADALILAGHRYGAEDGLDFSSQVTEFERYHAILTSIRRAKERGPFPAIMESMYDPELLRELGPGARHEGVMVDGVTPFVVNLWQAPTSFVEHRLDLGRPELDWEHVLEGIMEHGVRNSCQTTFAPTGTIATAAGVEGYGCEPVYGFHFIRTVMQEEENIELEYMSDLLEQALRKEGLTDQEIEAITSQLGANKGSCQEIEEIPEHLRRIFVAAADLTPREHVLMQATLQAWIDNSISKTINMLNSATAEDVAEAYRLAYETGCKGITIYREGSRDLEVLSTSKLAGKTGEKRSVDVEHWPIIRPLPLPQYIDVPGAGLPSYTYGVRTPFGTLHATLTELREHPGRLYDTRLGIGRAGQDVPAFTEALGRLFSWGVRLGGDPRDGAEQLIGIGGATKEQGIRQGEKALSVPDAIGKLIAAHVDAVSRRDSGEVGGAHLSSNGAPSQGSGNLCPECGKGTLAYLEGCVKCTDYEGCGFNRCE